MYLEIELIQIGTGYLDTHRFEKAIDIFTKAIEINSKNSQTFELRAIAWYRINELENALNDINKAIDLDVENHSAWFNKGEILRYNQKYLEAEICYGHANSIYPNSSVYLSGLIITNYVQKKFDAVIQLCNQILEHSPIHSLALFNRGSAYAAKSNYLAAIKDSLKLIETDKITAVNFNNLGFFYLQIGEYRKAYNNLTLCLQLDPLFPYALSNLGHLKYKEGDYKKALELINNSLEIDSSNSYAYKNRAIVYIKTGEKDLALKDLEKSKFLGYSDDYGNEVDELLKVEFNIE